MDDKITKDEVQQDIYSLIDDIAKLYDSFVGKSMPYGHRKVLMCLSHGEEVDQFRLVEEANITNSSVSGMVKKMESQGYVTRHSYPNDQRKTLVQITDKGMARYRLICEKSKDIEDTMLFSVPLKERQTLAATLEAMLKRLLEERERYK